MTDSLAKPVNLPEPHYTPEKGGWRVASGQYGPAPIDYANAVLSRDGSIFSGSDADWCADNKAYWRNDNESNDIIAYLAKPACICTRSATYIVDPDCPACNRVGEPSAFERRFGPIEEGGILSSPEAQVGYLIEKLDQAERAFEDVTATYLPKYQAALRASRDLPTARARCEAAGLVVLQKRIEEHWFTYYDDIQFARDLGLIRPSLILPDDGETK